MSIVYLAGLRSLLFIGGSIRALLLVSFTLLDGLEHMIYVVPAVGASRLPCLCLLDEQSHILGGLDLLDLCPVLALDPCWVVLAPIKLAPSLLILTFARASRDSAGI